MTANRRARGFVYLIAALCGYALFLLITLPAYWADWLLGRASHNAIGLQQTEGTLWNGAGNLMLRNTVQQPTPAAMAWSIQPWWLLTGKLQVHLRSRDSSSPSQATLRIGYRHLSIRDVDASVPASVLSAINPAVDLVAPSGRLQITASQATLTPAGLEGSLQLTWLGAGARMGGLNEVGDYRLLVNGRGPTAELRIETLRGDVGITAQGEWQAQGEGLLRLAGNITPGNREQTLRPLLTMVNVQINNGQYSWTLTRRFPPAQIIGATMLQ